MQWLNPMFKKLFKKNNNNKCVATNEFVHMHGLQDLAYEKYIYHKDLKHWA